MLVQNDRKWIYIIYNRAEEQGQIYSRYCLVGEDRGNESRNNEFV